MVTHGHPVDRFARTVTWCSVTDLSGKPCGSRIDPEAESAMCRSHVEAGWKHVNRQMRELREAGWEANRAADEDHRERVGVVYFARVQERIKIGTTVDLRSRMQALGVDEVLHTIPGSYKLENELHRRFDHLRIKNEQFEPAPELLDFIEALKAAG